MRRPRVLAVRLDNNGDVLLAGPALRALAAGARELTLWCGPRGRAAAELLPGLDRVIEHRAAWIDPQPPPLSASDTMQLVNDLSALAIDQAFVFTSFHQSPLPSALLLRLAGVPFIAATSEDYPGSLLDIRHRISDDVHEVERSLSLVAAAGYRLPPDDAGKLQIARRGSNPLPEGFGPYVVVHPGASAPARAWGPAKHAALVDALVEEGARCVITGSDAEVGLTSLVARPPRRDVLDLGGSIGFAALAEVLAGADAVVVGNTGPAHLAAAVGTPVVSLFAPTVPAVRWRPWRVPSVLLGEQGIPCAGCRAKLCPVEGHPCIDDLAVEEVLAALHSVARRSSDEPLLEAAQ
jgi:ADP-heptose:LPS heptosyltransferase